MLVEIAALLCGNLVGAIPFAHLVGQWRKRDLRRLGTGNLGASNAYRQVGKLWGALVLLLDLLKALLPMLALHYFWESEWGPVLWAVGAFLGHCWPIWLGFSTGGRGVAVLAGMYVAFGFFEGTGLYLLGAVFGYGSGLIARKPGFAVLIMVIGTIAFAPLAGAAPPVAAGSVAALALLLLRRSFLLPSALATGANRRAAIWLALAEDTVPGQSL